jgi:hypothetical protein
MLLIITYKSIIGNNKEYVKREFTHRHGSRPLQAARASPCPTDYDPLGAAKLGIAIIEENTVLRDWYVKNGCRPTGTKKFGHLPFTVGFLEYYL